MAQKQEVKTTEVEVKQKTIGEVLKKAREAKNLTLDETAAETSIRKLYLQAVEDNDFTQVPGDVYVKGILRTYGNYLGLDGTALVEEYKIRAKGMAPEAAVSESIRVADEVKVSPTFKPNEDDPAQNKSMVFTILFVVIVLLIAAGAYYFFFMNNHQIFSNQAKPSTSQSEPLQKPAAPANQAGNTAKPAAVPQAPVPAGEAVKGLVTVTLKCNGSCWVQVSEGDKELYQGVMNKDQTHKFSSKNGLTIVYGNIKDMNITLNGKPLPVDNSGTVVTREYKEIVK